MDYQDPSMASWDEQQIAKDIFLFISLDDLKDLFLFHSHEILI